MHRRNLIHNALLAACSLILALACVELGFRVYDGHPVFLTENFIRKWKQDEMRHERVLRHQLLGWVPKDGYSSPGENILENGVRSNGQPLPAPGDGPLILAVGDSFTYGDQVKDDETWPACLERLSGCRVINAGVWGYGTDQAVLRAKFLLPEYKPDIVILSVYVEDIQRSAQSVKGLAPKPFFQVVDGGLQLNNVPVPYPEARDKDIPMGWQREIFGRSAFVHHMMCRLAPSYWLFSANYAKFAHHQGLEVACLLLKDLADAVGSARLIVMIQYNKSINTLGIVDPLFDCRPSQKVEWLDLRPALETLKEQNPRQFDSLFYGHMTARGNEFVARQLLPFVQPAPGSIPPVDSGAP